jgi:hypothetical protein
MGTHIEKFTRHMNSSGAFNLRCDTVAVLVNKCRKFKWAEYVYLSVGTQVERLTHCMNSLVVLIFDITLLPF